MSTLWIESFPEEALKAALPGRGGLPSRGVAVASANPDILLQVRRREVNLAVWNRDLPDSLSTAALRRFMRAAPFSVVAEGPPAKVAGMLLDRLPRPAPPDLMLDVFDLAMVFAALDGDAPAVRARLEALTHDGCTRWHADAVGLRLLCTYRGGGTEWLPLDGGAAAARAIGRDAAPRCATQIPTGAVAILKGEAYRDPRGQANAGGGCIHRSPPAGRGRRARLLLCIDQIRWNLPT
ncbi:MAG TPA: DUF1826 domain-containing protein [Rhodopila sp.]